MTRREVRSCAEGRWECGLGFPARGRKAAGSAPGREPRNHCGHAGRAPPEPGSGRTRPREFFFFFFRLFPSGLFLSSFLWQLERMLQQRMAAASSRFSEFRSLGAPHPTSCPNGPAGALAKATRTFSVFPSASLVSLLQVSEPRPGDNPLAPGCVS